MATVICPDPDGIMSAAMLFAQGEVFCLFADFQTGSYCSI
jgi:hypothetical protein